jgi:hypothetical protein
MRIHAPPCTANANNTFMGENTNIVAKGIAANA